MSAYGAQQETANETSRLLPSSDTSTAANKQVATSSYQAINDAELADNSKPAEQRYSRVLVAQVVGALFIGVFTSNVDGSLVLATHPVISSEFHNLDDSSWLFISFWLAGSATQSLYGKLSDIYSRKSILLLSYGLFALGCALIGLGQSMWQIILGRVISGSGQAGMWVLAAIVITDLAPIREVASWQSYLNVVATVGRSLGGPLGGFLADMVGWRWSFLGQVPIFLVAMVLCWRVFSKLDEERPEHQKTVAPQNNLANFDFLGISTLGFGILALMLPLEIGGQKVSWSHPIIYALFTTGAILLGIFVMAESRWAKEPIFPLRLLRNRQALLGYLIIGCILAAQSGMVFTVPLYFQVTQRSSSTLVGARLFPAVAGNALGGILSGYLIRRTGRYKFLAIFASLTSALGYSMMTIRWNGNTSWAESLYIFPGGLGCGIIQSAVFIVIQTAIDPEDKAAGISGFFLATQIGTVIGMAAVSALMIGGLRQMLTAKLLAQGMSQVELDTILKQALTSVDYLDKASKPIARAIVASYVRGLEYSHVFSVISSIIAFCAALLLREQKLGK
ncbi:major facilitator superfamily transporter [Nemania sp. FL0916]|nr:major facilitator superfamily transporter [Nemania sp. FL0916]